ncbi:rod shape-determining protein MreC [Litorimonas sp. RW-G-Af-16]
MLLNVGREQGVMIGNPVMSADGLIGHIINIGKTSSRVLLLGDLNSRISVMARDHESRAILAGDNLPQPKLSFVAEGAPWAAGDVVITSGDDGMLPRGLFIGEVVRGERGELRVQLGSDSQALDWVWVSPFVPITLTEDDLELDPPATTTEPG